MSRSVCGREAEGAFAVVAGVGRLMQGGLLSDIVPFFGSANMIGGERDH